MPAIPPNLIAPSGNSLRPSFRAPTHHRSDATVALTDSVGFEKLVQGLVFGCAYHRIAARLAQSTSAPPRRVDRAGGDGATQGICLEVRTASSAWSLGSGRDACITSPLRRRESGRSP